MPVVEFIEDVAVDAEVDRQLRQLLSTCFTKPEDIVFRDRRYFHLSPRWRWLVRGDGGELIAHVAVHDKVIGTIAGDVRIAGVAEVCVHPQHRGQGLVREVLATAHVWLAARDIPVALLFGDKKHYASSGYRNITNPLRCQNPETKEWSVKPSDWIMMKPLRVFDWPAGVIDLCGSGF